VAASHYSHVLMARQWAGN